MCVGVCVCVGRCVYIYILLRVQCGVQSANHTEMCVQGCAFRALRTVPSVMLQQPLERCPYSAVRTELCVHCHSNAPAAAKQVSAHRCAYSAVRTVLCVQSCAYTATVMLQQPPGRCAADGHALDHGDKPGPVIGKQAWQGTPGPGTAGY